MSEFVRCSEREFLWNIAYSENHSQSRHGDRWRNALGPEVSSSLDRGDRSALTEPDWSRIRAAFQEARGDYLTPLLELQPEWYRGSLELRCLPDLLLIDWEPFRRLAPSRKLGEFVHALDEGRDSAPDFFAERYRRLRPTFDLEKVRGIPILVAERREGPYLEIDGLTRMSILVSRWERGEAVPPRVEVLLGVSAELRRWKWF